MSIILSCLATVSVLVSLKLAFKAGPNLFVGWLCCGSAITILIIWGQRVNRLHGSKQDKRRHQEIVEKLNPILEYAKAKYPNLDDMAAIKSLLTELERQGSRGVMIMRAAAGAFLCRRSHRKITFLPLLHF